MNGIIRIGTVDHPLIIDNQKNNSKKQGKAYRAFTGQPIGQRKSEPIFFLFHIKGILMRENCDKNKKKSILKKSNWLL